MKDRTTTLPCALCVRLLDQRADKNGKPYFVCEPCGTQFFIRGTAGRERLESILRGASSHKKPIPKLDRSTSHDQEMVRHELRKMQAYIETFCADQLVVPEPPYDLDNAIGFPAWSREIFGKIRKAFDTMANA